MKYDPPSPPKKTNGGEDVQEVHNQFKLAYESALPSFSTVAGKVCQIGTNDHGFKICPVNAS